MDLLAKALSAAERRGSLWFHEIDGLEVRARIFGRIDRQAPDPLGYGKSRSR